ncbi:hypothetical protein AN416_26670 [Paraburkholderia caribensis]|nr:hypothetical protein AN416_26670 [Paraburkholderia caribensis]AMV45935.1 hypothetical protein ATN79_28760 [Paraburkholderia caribensis]AUT55000.1 hypothetical protein C2L66_24795 [Paraburkholderia caribensis]
MIGIDARQANSRKRNEMEPAMGGARRDQRMQVHWRISIKIQNDDAEGDGSLPFVIHVTQS